MHPTGQVLNYDERDEFQSRGPKHLHVPVHLKDAPKTDESPDSEATDLLITFVIRDKDSYPKLWKLVTTVQNHKHALGKKVLHVDLVHPDFHFKPLIQFT